MHNNQFLKAAIEQINMVDPVAIDPALSVQTLAQHTHADSDVAALLIAEQSRNSELQETLIEQRLQLSSNDSDNYRDALDSAAVAVESLLSLGSTLAIAIENNEFSSSGNAGFAMALESMLLPLGITDALEDAAAESRALMVHDFKGADTSTHEKAESIEQQAKTGGILESVKKKVLIAYQFVLRVGRRIVDVILNMLELIKLQNHSDKSFDIKDIEAMTAAKFVGKITDADFIKQVGLSKTADLTSSVRATFAVIDRSYEFLGLYPEFVRKVIVMANSLEKDDLRREDIIAATNKIASTLGSVFNFNNNAPMPDNIKKLVSPNVGEVISSPPLLGGHYAWVEITNTEGKLPKINVRVERDRVTDLPTEVETISPIIYEAATKLATDLETRGKKRFEEIASIVKRLNSNAPSSFQNLDNLEDNISFTTQAVSMLGGLTAQLASQLQGVLVIRSMRVLNIWTGHSVRVYKESLKTPAPAAGGTSDEQGEKAAAAAADTAPPQTAA